MKLTNDTKFDTAAMRTLLKEAVKRRGHDGEERIMDRYENALAKLDEWSRKEKAAVTKRKRWQKKVRYYEKQGMAARR